MAGIAERYFRGSVRSWIYYDEESSVFGHPSVIEADLVIADHTVLIGARLGSGRGK